MIAAKCTVAIGTPFAFESAFAVRPSGFKKLLVENFTRSCPAALTHVAQRINQQGKFR